MRWRRTFSLFGASALCGGCAFAASATPEGAREILQDYAAYFSRAVVDKGIVSVEPEGEGYLVTWSLQKALDAADAPKDAVHVDNFAYTLTPGPGDSWSLKAYHFPQVAFDVPTDKGEVKGILAFDGFHLENLYDPRSEDFLRSTLGADSLTGSFHVADGAQASDFKFSQDALTIETRAKPSADGAGADVAIAQAFKSLTETATAPQPGGSEPPAPMTYTVAGAVSGATFTGLRVAEIGEFWKYVVAHAGEAGTPPDLKPLLGAMLPLWRQLRAKAELDDLRFELPMGTATLKSLGESVEFSGLTSSGIAEIGVAIQDLAVASTLLPDWVASLSPASLDIGVRLTGDDWDKAARLALDDPHFGQSGDLSPETSQQIGQVLMAGHPKLVLTPGHFRIPALDLAFEGEASMAAGTPTAHLHVSADSLDRTIELLQDFAEVTPDAQGALLGVTLLKGLATTDKDGRLVWEIETDGTAVTVNGSALPTGP